MSRTGIIVPEGLPDPLDWMYELSDPIHVVAGTAEILGGLGLILPGLTRILPGLTPLAAAGLVLVMIGAAVWHGTRGEVFQIVLNLVTVGLLGYLAYGRWRLSPLQGATPTRPPSDPATGDVRALEAAREKTR